MKIKSVELGATKCAEAPGEKMYKIGEKATDDNYQFTVTKIRFGVSRVGDSYDNEKPQGQFCLVSMKVKNVGNDAITFSDENQALDEINQGNTLKTILPFDVPKKVH